MEWNLVVVVIIGLELWSWIRLWTTCLRSSVCYPFAGFPIVQYIPASAFDTVAVSQRRCFFGFHSIASIQLSPSSRCVQPHVLPKVFNDIWIIFRKYLQVRVSSRWFIKDSSRRQKVYRYRCRVAMLLVSARFEDINVVKILRGPITLTAGGVRWVILIMQWRLRTGQYGVWSMDHARCLEGRTYWQKYSYSLS